MAKNPSLLKSFEALKPHAASVWEIIWPLAVEC
jgi:hypothetical protein